MNRALVYLVWVLLKRRALHFCRSLRQPFALLGFVALVSLGAVLFHFRQEKFFAELVRRESLIGAALLMFGGSLIKGFWQRGLAFDPPDIEFLFTSPFSQRQVILYRLLPSYLFAVVEGMAFLGLFGWHLRYPFVTTACFILFQIACFHVATGASIFAGTLTESSHYRMRWMLVTLCFLQVAVYLRTAWEIHLVPAFLRAPVVQLLFYPTISLSDLATSESFLGTVVWLLKGHSLGSSTSWQPIIFVASFAIIAGISLWLVVRLKANLFEASLSTTARAAERKLYVRQGRRLVAANEFQARSLQLPRFSWFQGTGAIVWKNLVLATRSKRDLVLALVFTLIYTGFFIAVRWALSRVMATGGELGAREIADFDLLLASFIGFLAFILQRTLWFDFRSDGHHLLSFRTLPFSPLALAAAEIAVPTILCLVFQALGIAMVMCFAQFRWPTMLLILLSYPAVAVALNGVWNLHYLISATRVSSGKSQSATAVGTLLVVAFSFLIFYPASWVGFAVARYFDHNEHVGIPLSIATWLIVQYAVDFVLLIALAKLFQKADVSRLG